MNIRSSNHTWDAMDWSKKTLQIFCMNCSDVVVCFVFHQLPAFTHRSCQYVLLSVLPVQLAFWSAVSSTFACSCQKASDLIPVVTRCVQTSCTDATDRSKATEILFGEAPVETQPSATEEPKSSGYTTPSVFLLEYSGSQLLLS